MHIAAYGLSERNTSPDKPNEDAFAIHLDGRRCVLVVADGVTRSPRADGSYPQPSGAQLASRVVAQTLAAHLADVEEAPDFRQAFQVANIAVDQLNRTHRVWERLDYEEYDLFGAVATAAVIQGRDLFWGHIGDTCLLIHDERTPVQQLTPDQVRAAMDRLDRLQSDELNGENRLYYSRARLRNHPQIQASYGVLTGEDNALTYVDHGRRTLTSGATVLLCSDALTCLRREGPTGWRELQPLLQDIPWEQIGPNLIATAQQREKDGHLRSDDKTVIVARVIAA
ncbi:MAG: protein phosphatase 2C domain-containing protein [Chloroflexi bacterium]|nr:protein phosphatase 2C domain-containing protein [Chloroflexota bacterium]